MTATTAVERLRSAIDRALANGITRREILNMVAAAAPPPAHSNAARRSRNWPTNPNEIIYDEVPPGLLTLAQAAKRYKVRHNTLSVAINRGTLPWAGRVRGQGAGGLQVVIAEAALRNYLKLPPLPPEEAEAQSAGLPDDLPYYAEPPAGTITVPAAARRFGPSVQDLHRWLVAGKLTRMGYLQGGTRSDGRVLLSEAEVKTLATPAKIWTPADEEPDAR